MTATFWRLVDAASVAATVVLGMISVSFSVSLSVDCVTIQCCYRYLYGRLYVEKMMTTKTMVRLRHSELGGNRTGNAFIVISRVVELPSSGFKTRRGLNQQSTDITRMIHRLCTLR